MIKSVLKELLITLLLVVAIILILTVLFYDSIPVNKVVPNQVTYTLPDNLKEELDKTVEEEQKVIVTYKIDDEDLDTYERNDSYNPGKIDPFSASQSTSKPTTSVTGTAVTDDSAKNNSSGKDSKSNTDTSSNDSEIANQNSNSNDSSDVVAKKSNSNNNYAIGNK